MDGFEIPRKNKYLQEAINTLDARLASCQNDVASAWSAMTDLEKQFVVGEFRKIIKSPRYYLENYHVIRTKKLGLITLYPMWDSQEIFMESFERQLAQGGPIRIIALKARQMGYTTLGVAIMFWLAITRQLCNVLSMSDEEERTLVNFDMARIAWENLPWTFKPEKRGDIRGKLLWFDKKNPDERNASPGLRSMLQFESANQPSGSAYSKALFGAHLAEVSRYRAQATITEGIFGSLGRTDGTIGIMESTAHGRGNTWHRICRNSQAGKLNWEFLFIDRFREPGYCIAIPEGFSRTQEEEDMVKMYKETYGKELTDGQLAWSRETEAQFKATAGDDDGILTFQQEFPLTPAQAFIATGTCAFNKTRLNDQLINFCRPPKWVGEISLNPDNQKYKLVNAPGGRLKVWEWPRENGTYYIGGDPSLGVQGGDPACAEIYWVPDDLTKPLYQVAEWHGLISPTSFARVLAALGYLYNTAEISVECNRIDSTNSDLAKVLMYPKWYRYMREDKIKNAFGNFIGWQTTERNKNGMISKFNEAVCEITVVIRCEQLIEECYDFTDETGEGRHFSARADSHDDRVMAAMIAFYCATQIRPRLDEESSPKPPPDQDFQNSDYSPVYDDEKQSQNTEIIRFDTL